jgi:hypothetical protein
VYRHAQFKPHKDSGAGAGQGVSLIVGLGDYAGGELACEPLGGGPFEVHGIRYQPLEFHGWQQRHWCDTAPNITIAIITVIAIIASTPLQACHHIHHPPEPCRTLPFEGERYSLVWFTPKGCEVEE